MCPEFLNNKNSNSRYEKGFKKNPQFHKERKHRAWRQWRIHAWKLSGPPNLWRSQLVEHYARQPVFAMISGIGNKHWQPVHEFCEQFRLPCLFPNTDTPVTDEDNQYNLYFSAGLDLESRLLLKDLESSLSSTQSASTTTHKQSNSLSLLQVYRADSAGAFAANRTKLGAEATADELILSELALPSKASKDNNKQTLSERLQNVMSTTPTDAVVLWLAKKDLATLTEQMFLPASSVARSAEKINGQPDQPVWQNSRIYTSASLLGFDSGSLFDHWPEHHQIRPFGLQDETIQGVLRTRFWLNARKIEQSHIRVQSATLAALTMLTAALAHVDNFFNRLYLIETIEHGAETSLATGVFPGLSLGPQQRFASTGGYIVHRPASNTTGRATPITKSSTTKPATRWIVPFNP